MSAREPHTDNENQVKESRLTKERDSKKQNILPQLDAHKKKYKKKPKSEKRQQQAQKFKKQKTNQANKNNINNRSKKQSMQVVSSSRSINSNSRMLSENKPQEDPELEKMKISQFTRNNNSRVVARESDKRMRAPKRFESKMISFCHDEGFVWGECAFGWSNYRLWVLVISLTAGATAFSLGVLLMEFGQDGSQTNKISSSLFMSVVAVFVLQNVALLVDNLYLSCHKKSNYRYSVVLVSNLTFWILMAVFTFRGLKNFYIVSTITLLVNLVDVLIDKFTNQMDNPTHYRHPEVFLIVTFRTLLALKLLDASPSLTYLIAFLPLIALSLIVSCIVIFKIASIFFRRACGGRVGEFEWYSLAVPALIIPFAPTVYLMDLMLEADQYKSNPEKFVMYKWLIVVIVAANIAILWLIVKPFLGFRIIKIAEWALKLKEKGIMVNKLFQRSRPTILNFLRTGQTMFVDKGSQESQGLENDDKSRLEVDEEARGRQGSNNPPPSVRRVSKLGDGEASKKKKKNQESTEKIKDENLCVVCFNKEANTIFEQCRHGGVCADCVRSIFKKRKECPMCRMKTKSVLVYTVNNRGEYIQVDEIR